MDYKDYYATLGVPKDADADTIKQAYRRLARKYHPDVSEEAGAEESFKAVNEAYEVLGNTSKRSKYDRITPPPRTDSVREKQAAHSSTAAKRERFDAAYFEAISKQEAKERDNGFSDFFEQMFGKKNRKKTTDPHQPPLQPPQPEDTLIMLGIEELFQDSIKPVRIPGGDVIQVRIPKGAVDGKKIRLPGKGLQGNDLTLILRIAPHPHYRIEGADIYRELPVSPWEAALGASITVPTPQGTAVTLKIPANSQTGKKMRLNGRGLPDGEQAGDFYLVLHIHTPPAHTAAEKALYTHMQQLFSWTPRDSA